MKRGSDCAQDRSNYRRMRANHTDTVRASGTKPIADSMMLMRARIRARLRASAVGGYLAVVDALIVACLVAQALF
jgi:hypothetical protein